MGHGKVQEQKQAKTGVETWPSEILYPRFWNYKSAVGKRLQAFSAVAGSPLRKP